jgi:superfamily II DNA/RNA helicase
LTMTGKTCSFLLPVVAALGEQQRKDQMDNEDATTTDDKNKPLEPAKPKCVVLA